MYREPTNQILVTQSQISKAPPDQTTASQPKKSKAPPPAFRRLRGYAFDPSLSIQMETALVNETVFKVNWEEGLEPGPVGEYVEVVDYDPASRCCYEPADLSAPLVLAQDGLPPSEGNPQFHQQMVYAVAMTTIRNFERALGRWALWAPRIDRSTIESDNPEGDYVQQLRIYPHALREANAYYSPAKKALLFGYFPASSDSPGSHFPGGTVFTCLSHDIIAHETTHALLDGMHCRFIEPNHPDALAFHEAFADIVALFQHFSFPEILRHQIAKTRGDLASQSLLGELAQQFGQAMGHYGALRDAIGRVNPATKQWEPHTPDPEEYQTIFEPHERGAILVAAVFDAFLTIYKSRVADLLRIASSGTGVLPAGALHPDLVNRLASEASKSAQHVLNMCIRALDYCPPIDITFGNYLRAIITADSDLVPDDDMGYRVAFIEAFRRRGIYPHDVRTLSVDSLRWPLIREEEDSYKNFEPIAEKLRSLPEKTRYLTCRRDAFVKIKDVRRELHQFIKYQLDNRQEFEKVTNLVLSPGNSIAGLSHGPDGHPKVEVHSLRPAQRVGPDGNSLWKDWIQNVEQQKPNLLVLLPHTETSRGSLVLKIGEENEVKVSRIGDPNLHFVRVTRSQWPVVLLVGCQTDDQNLGYISIPTAFRWAGASIVLATLTDMRGRYAAPLAGELVKELVERSTAGKRSTFGEVMLALRRIMLARGFPAVLALVAYGDADWELGKIVEEI